MSADERPFAAALAAFATVALFALFASVGFVEDWDGGGFALACRSVDLARFRPHPPGYPAYTVIAAALGALGLEPAACAGWLARASALSLALFAAALTVFARGSWPRRAATAALCSLCIPGVLRVGTMVSPMALALAACVLAAVASYTRRRPASLASLALGLALSARPSDALALSGVTLALASSRLPLARVGLAASLVALVAHGVLIVCARIQDFTSLATRQLATHAELTEASRSHPWFDRAQALRGFALERDGALASAMVVALLALALRALWTLPNGRRARAVVGASLCVGWVLFAQPPQVERHWLYVGALVVVALVRGLTVDPSRVVRLASLCVALAGLVVGGVASIERHAHAPGAVQMGRFVRSRGGALFAGRSGRAAEVEGVAVYEARHMGEVRAIAERLSRWPGALWVTDEVRTPTDSRARDADRVFCGPRSARGEPVCVRVRTVHLLGDTRDSGR